MFGSEYKVWYRALLRTLGIDPGSSFSEAMHEVKKYQLKAEGSIEKAREWAEGDTAYQQICRTLNLPKLPPLEVTGKVKERQEAYLLLDSLAAKAGFSSWRDYRDHVHRQDIELKRLRSMEKTLRKIFPEAKDVNMALSRAGDAKRSREMLGELVGHFGQTSRRATVDQIKRDHPVSNAHYRELEEFRDKIVALFSNKNDYKVDLNRIANRAERFTEQMGQVYDAFDVPRNRPVANLLKVARPDAVKPAASRKKEGTFDYYRELSGIDTSDNAQVLGFTLKLLAEARKGEKR